MTDKIFPSPSSGLKGLLVDGMAIMSGGLAFREIPATLIPEVRASGVRGMAVISNNADADGFGSEQDQIIRLEAKTKQQFCRPGTRSHAPEILR